MYKYCGTKEEGTHLVTTLSTLKETDGEQGHIQLELSHLSKNALANRFSATFAKRKVIWITLLNNHWMPSAKCNINYVLLFNNSVGIIGVSNAYGCKLGLVYSSSQQVVYYCTYYCMLFNPENVRNQEICKLVMELLHQCKHTWRDFKNACRVRITTGQFFYKTTNGV